MGLNNKGFAISGMLYASLILFLVLLFGVLSIMANRKIVLDKEKNEIINELNGVTDTGPFYTDYNEIKGVNAPKLATGMTPIKWSGTSWINTTEDDPEWYDYTNKKWANVKTEDGSFWVWIPRYAYQISSGYHTETTGTINVKFLIDNTNLTIDETTIDDTPIYNGDSQTNYVSHPAFTFGNTELTGMWVAKFEPSNDGSNNVSILPGVISWRNITVSDTFDLVLNMKSNLLYGWIAEEVDTHMMKNNEWGAIAYLSKSNYGKVSEVWVNPANDHTTGCAGDSDSSSNTSGCINSYETENGQNASTTGNIYGIFDMSGGAYERTAAYVNNGHGSLTTYGSSILSADDKYKDVYIVTTDSQAENYNNSVDKNGDSVYETSSSGSGYSSWNGDISYMPYSPLPWFARGGSYSNNAQSGLYNFYYSMGEASSVHSFRPIVLVGDGL